MRPEALTPTRALLAERIVPEWRLPLLRLALALGGLLMLFAPVWADMARQWWDSSTYNHILLVPAILGWLVWQRAPELARLAPKAWWPGLVPFAGAALIWLLGDISGTATAAHLGVVAMVQASVLALLGPRVAMALIFPLGFGLFLVPLGDELVPALQMITASITIWLTTASGIPAAIDGVFIDTPVGLFEVAEACSGVKFLVAMVALGTLVAHLCFRSWWRRAAFLLAAVVLPILANGVRAWGTIYIAQSQGIAFAEGFDHIFYGWIFFGLVMAILLGASWRFFDRQPDDPVVFPERLQASRLLGSLERFGAPAWPVLAALAGIALATIAWADAARAIEAELPREIALPGVDGWERVPFGVSYPWHPRMAGADHRLAGSYRNAAGQQVDIVYALYAAQDDGREASAFGEGALPPGGAWRWMEAIPAIDSAVGERLQALGRHRRVAMTWYRHGGWTGGSRIALKLAAMRDRLLLRQVPTAMLIVSAPESEAGDGGEAIAAFHRSVGPLGNWMDRIAGLD